MRPIHLSRRLQAIADMVTPGNVVADVGCDHGFLAIWLVEQGIAPKVIATDVRRGPLAAAEAHVEERGLSAYIETRLSDGLEKYSPGEAGTLVCAGMGGRLMQSILLKNADVTRAFRELILQPQSELRQFRIFLREQGFVVTDENILCEDGKYYFLFRVEPGVGPGGTKQGDRDFSENAPVSEYERDEELLRLGEKYGTGLLAVRHPVLKAYLEKCLMVCVDLREQMLSHRGKAGESERIEQGLAENEAEIADLEKALAIYEEGKVYYGYSDN